MTKNGFKVENSGDNQGIIVGENNGNITISMPQIGIMPSLIAALVKTLGEICAMDDYNENTEKFKEYRHDEKIEYNNVIKYREIIKEFSAYYSLCEKHLNIYDDSNIRGKAKILKCVHLWYLQAKGELIAQNASDNVDEMEIVRKNSDKIIDMVKEKIYYKVVGAKEFDSMHMEDVELGIECFTCFCFMECKILEKPV